MPTPALRDLGVVFAGGMLGVGARFAIETAWPAHLGGWPWATFVINVTGSFALGFLYAFLGRRGPNVGARRLVRLGLGTGVIGGYTTYSTFAVETARLVEGGAAGIGIGYAVLSVVLGVAAAGLGAWIVPRRRGKPA